MPISLSLPRLLRTGCVGAGLLAGRPASAQTPAPVQTIPGRPHLLSVSVAELFYKVQLGYEHQLGGRNSVGISGLARYGLGRPYQGWQVSGYYRRFLTRQFPTGLYVQAQASLFNFEQQARLYSPTDRSNYSFYYRGLSGGGGLGLGYRGYLLRQATHGYLLWNAMLGGRAQARPAPAYDATRYQPVSGFLGDSDVYDWHMGFSPGSIVHGQLSLDYQF